jgi:channel protein (hemolysin III family)
MFIGRLSYAALMPPTSIPGFADPFSSLSHLLGALVFLGLGFLLIRRGRGNPARVASLIIFIVGSVLLLSVSGFYHMLDPNGKPRHVMRALDHAAIFVLIASSFTPPHVILFRGIGRWGVLLLVWSFAAVAVTVRAVFFDGIPQPVLLGLYLGMGWIGLIGGIALWLRLGYRFVAPLLWGGIAYSIGALLEFARWPTIIPGVVQPHEVFHLAVLIGLALHWSFIYGMADGRLSPPVPCDDDPTLACPAPLQRG